MEKQKNLTENKKLESRLYDFLKGNGIRLGDGQKNTLVLKLAIELAGGAYKGRKIKKIKGLYSLSEGDILNIQRYGKKTFNYLNSILYKNGLPNLQLPAEYASSPHLYQ